MYVDKAIEILEDLLTTLPQVPPEDRRDAVRLGIEALKRHKRNKTRDFPVTYSLLPGETNGGKR